MSLQTHSHGFGLIYYASFQIGNFEGRSLKDTEFSTGKAHQGDGEMRGTQKSIHNRKRITLLSDG
jgi:hypothetical protein